MQIDRTGQSMANLANTGAQTPIKKKGSELKTDDLFSKEDKTVWKNFQLDQKIAVVRHQITSDKKKSKAYSLLTKGLVALGIGGIIGGSTVSAVLGAPFIGLGLMGIGMGTMFLGGKTYRRSEALEMRAMSGDSKMMLMELEKMGNNMGIET